MTLFIIDVFFFFNDTATTEIYTLSLHDALPISISSAATVRPSAIHFTQDAPPINRALVVVRSLHVAHVATRSEEHTSELQSRQYLVCRLLLEKKKKTSPLTLTISISASTVYSLH